MVDHKDTELAQVKVIKTALRKSRKYDNLAKNYGDYGARSLKLPLFIM